MSRQHRIGSFQIGGQRSGAGSDHQHLQHTLHGGIFVPAVPANFKQLGDKKIYIASALRLIVLPALFIALLKLIGVESRIILLCMFAFGTPLGLNTVVFPAAYGGDPSTGVSMATISHTACVITIPIMYALLTTFVL